MEGPAIFKYTPCTTFFGRVVLILDPTLTKLRPAKFITEATQKKNVARMAGMAPVVAPRACLKLPPPKIHQL